MVVSCNFSLVLNIVYGCLKIIQYIVFGACGFLQYCCFHINLVMIDVFRSVTRWLWSLWLYYRASQFGHGLVNLGYKSRRFLTIKILFVCCCLLLLWEAGNFLVGDLVRGMEVNIYSLVSCMHSYLSYGITFQNS